MNRKQPTEKAKSPAPVKKTPAQREKEEKENRLAALSRKVRDKMSDEKNIESAAEQIQTSDLAGMQVCHRKFGQGEIASCDGRIFKVDFSNVKSIRMQFPVDTEILKPEREEDQDQFELICEQFRSIDSQKETVRKRIQEISAEMSRINL